MARVEALAEEERQPIMHKGIPNFEWTPGEFIMDDTHTEQEGIMDIAHDNAAYNEGYI